MGTENIQIDVRQHNNNVDGGEDILERNGDDLLTTLPLIPRRKHGRSLQVSA